MKQWRMIAGILAWSALLAGGGCGSPAELIDPNGEKALVTVSNVDPADWSQVAARAAGSLLASGALTRPDGTPSTVMVSRIRNYTMQHLETKILTGKLRQAIQQSHLGAVSSAVGYGCNIDLAVRRIRDKELDDLWDAGTIPKRGTVIAPNMSLSGTIVQQTANKGRTEESYFLFHLVLTDLVSGVAVWEGCFEIAKQGTRSIL